MILFGILGDHDDNEVLDLLHDEQDPCRMRKATG
jgi:hypothetical protein